MHAAVWNECYAKFKKVFKEGEVYKLENINVKPYKNGSFRCINSDKQIGLNERTNVVHLEFDDEVIPYHEFDFTAYTEIPRFYENPDNKNLLIGKYEYIYIYIFYLLLNYLLLNVNVKNIIITNVCRCSRGCPRSGEFNEFLCYE